MPTIANGSPGAPGTASGAAVALAVAGSLLVRALRAAEGFRLPSLGAPLRAIPDCLRPMRRPMLLRCAPCKLHEAPVPAFQTARPRSSSARDLLVNQLARLLPSSLSR